MKTESQNLLEQKTVGVRKPSEHPKIRHKTSANNIEELSQQLSQHPKVKKALRQMELKTERDAKKPSRRAPKKIDPKAPKLLRKAVDQDERISELAQATQNVMGYFREASTLIGDKANGKRRSSKHDKAFVKKWSGIENDYQTMLKGACTIYRENPVLMASTKALAERPDDLQVFANPAFLGKDEMAVAKYLGVTPDEMNLYFEHSYLPNKDRVAAGLASENFGDALKAIAENGDQVPFELSPERLVQTDILTIGGDFWFLAGFFAQVFAVITTIVAVVTVVAAVAIVAIAAAAVIQAVAPVLENAGEWLSDEYHKIKDDWTELTKPRPEDERNNGFCKECSDQNDDKRWPAATEFSSLYVAKNARKPGQTGDSVDIKVVIRNAKGCCMSGQNVVIQAGLDPASFGDLYLPPLDILGQAQFQGIYPATWGPTTFQGGKRTLRVRYFLNEKLGEQSEIDVWPIGTNMLTELKEIQADKSWQSTTTALTAEQTVQMFGYALGNMSRTKMELHMPNCSFLHLASPNHLRRFDTLQDGRAAGLDNCAHCIGDSKR